ncbi:serine palmitoyltransferase component [Agyrium rufum]|nr:serine palmitoyltransferase component [Agyrium rufum]
MDLHEIQGFSVRFVVHLSDTFQKLPGSAVILRYIQSSYQNDPVRSIIELVLFLFALRYLLAPSYSTQKKNYVKLSDEEIDELVQDWTPEPLVAPLSSFEEAENEKRPVIVGPSAPKSKLSNGRTVTNLASYNYYNFNASEDLRSKAIDTLRTYGVGPCGPPGFYGTQDVHMRVQADIAAHLGVPACIIYAQAFSTISSVIPAFSKRGDIIVADEGCNYAIRKGIQISRSNVRWYKHNDMENLEKVLREVVREQAKRPLVRRFIICEGLSEDFGDMVDLPKIVELKYRYKFRLILDESWSFGVLGRTGRGITEHLNVDPTSVDMIVGSLAGPLCAGGGFCAGTEEIADHQRLSASAYTFSAALPAMLATTASETIALLQANPEIVTQMRDNVKAMWAQLDPRSDWVYCTSAQDNPMMILKLKPEVVLSKKLGSVAEQEQLLQDVVDECLTNGVLVTRVKALPRSTKGKDSIWESQAQPALKVCVTGGLTKKEVEKAGITIRHAITKVVNRRRLS